MRMLWFSHPKPVGSRKPVAVLVQRQTKKPTTLALDTTPPEVPALHGSGGGGARIALNFSVRYALLEYVGFMWQHGGYLIRRRRIGRAATYYLLAKTTAAAALHFVLQGRARHIYEFTVDEHGIVRTSPSGVTLIPWGDVSALRTYSCGLMMVLKRGTLPIPFRCLSGEQSSALVSLAAAMRALGR
jgi:hypothetical protein